MVEKTEDEPLFPLPAASPLFPFAAPAPTVTV
jgi:hypothetical protein